MRSCNGKLDLFIVFKSISQGNRSIGQSYIAADTPVCFITILSTLGRYYNLFLPFSGACSWSMLQAWHAPVDHQVYPETSCNVAKSVATTANIMQFRRSGHGIFPCPGCMKVYQYRRNMLSHLRLECGQVPKLKCDYCSYRSKKKYDLQRHIRRCHKGR